MVVFKGPNGGVKDNRYISYILDDNLTMGNWTSQYVQENGPGNVMDVSHISLYHRFKDDGNSTRVSEPSTMLALGLIGSEMFLSRRRQSH